MTSPLSQDLRERLVATVEAGSSRRQAAARFAVSPSAAVKLLQRVRATGSTAPGQIGGHRRAKLEGHEVGALAGLDLDELARGGETLALAELGDGPTLRFQAQPGAPLPSGRDAM